MRNKAVGRSCDRAAYSFGARSEDFEFRRSPAPFGGCMHMEITTRRTTNGASMRRRKSREWIIIRMQRLSLGIIIAVQTRGRRHHTGPECGKVDLENTLFPLASLSTVNVRGACVWMVSYPSTLAQRGCNRSHVPPKRSIASLACEPPPHRTRGSGEGPVFGGLRISCRISTIARSDPTGALQSWMGCHKIRW